MIEHLRLGWSWAVAHQGGISSSVLSVFFTDKFAISYWNQMHLIGWVAYNICQWKTLTKTLDEMPPRYRSLTGAFLVVYRERRLLQKFEMYDLFGTVVTICFFLPEMLCHSVSKIAQFTCMYNRWPPVSIHYRKIKNYHNDQAIIAFLSLMYRLITIDLPLTSTSWHMVAHTSIDSSLTQTKQATPLKTARSTCQRSLTTTGLPFST